MVGHLIEQRRKRGRPRIEHQSLGGTERKWCGSCKQWCLLESFRARSGTWDGLAKICRDCTLRLSRATRAKRIVEAVEWPPDTLKLCSTCRIEKAITEFRRQAEGKYGRQTRCRACSDVYNDGWRTRARDHRLAYNRTYYSTERGREVIADWHARNPEKYRAQYAVMRALASGKLKKPDACESCESVERLDGHHPDYAKPLEVMWLCRTCHKGWHRQHGEGLNAEVAAISAAG